jgi:hypothetical protein
MKVLELDVYKNTFKDEVSFDSFKADIIEALHSGVTPITLDREVVGTLMSADVAKDYLYERITKKILESPEVLLELQTRLENDALVDGPL